MGSSANEVLALSVSGAVRVVVAQLLEASLLLVERVSEESLGADALGFVRDPPAAGVLPAGVGDLANVHALLSAAVPPPVASPLPGLSRAAAHLVLAAVKVPPALVLGHADAASALREAGGAGAVRVLGAAGDALAAGADLGVQALTNARTTSWKMGGEMKYQGPKKFWNRKCSYASRLRRRTSCWLGTRCPWRRSGSWSSRSWGHR